MDEDEISDVDDGFGKPPDLNDVWKASVEKFDRQRQAFAQLESSLAEAINVIRQVIARSINELNQIPEYSHIRSFTEIERPPAFADWVQTIGFDSNVAELKASWTAESLYTAVFPIEQQLPLLTKTLVRVKRQSTTRVRNRQSQWTTAENHQAVLQDLQSQTDFAARIFADFLDPFLKGNHDFHSTLRSEMARIPTEIACAFEEADEEGRYCIIKPMWDEATDIDRVEVWEQSWHAMKMGRIRTLMRLQLTKPIIDASQKIGRQVELFKTNIFG